MPVLRLVGVLTPDFTRHGTVGGAAGCVARHTAHDDGAATVRRRTAVLSACAVWGSAIPVPLQCLHAHIVQEGPTGHRRVPDVDTPARVRAPSAWPLASLSSKLPVTTDSAYGGVLGDASGRTPKQPKHGRLGHQGAPLVVRGLPSASVPVAGRHDGRLSGAALARTAPYRGSPGAVAAPCCSPGYKVGQVRRHRANDCLLGAMAAQETPSEVRQVGSALRLQSAAWEH